MKTVLRKKQQLPRFAVDLRLARVRRGLTMKTVADKVGSTVPNISMLESGVIENPRMDLFINLCGVLDLKPSNYQTVRS